MHLKQHPTHMGSTIACKMACIVQATASIDVPSCESALNSYAMDYSTKNIASTHMRTRRKFVPWLLQVGLGVGLGLGGAALAVLLWVLLHNLHRRHRSLLNRVLPPGTGPNTTLLVTDIQNSTVLWESLPNSVRHGLASRHVSQETAGVPGQSKLVYSVWLLYETQYMQHGQPALAGIQHQCFFLRNGRQDIPRSIRHASVMAHTKTIALTTCAARQCR